MGHSEEPGVFFSFWFTHQNPGMDVYLNLFVGRRNMARLPMENDLHYFKMCWFIINSGYFEDPKIPGTARQLHSLLPCLKVPC